MENLPPDAHLFHETADPLFPKQVEMPRPLHLKTEGSKKPMPAILQVPDTEWCNRNTLVRAYRMGPSGLLPIPIHWEIDPDWHKIPGMNRLNIFLPDLRRDLVLIWDVRENFADQKTQNKTLAAGILLVLLFLRFLKKKC